MSIDTIESLRQHLQAALMVEHFTIPPYLCALYSIEDGTNREAAAVIQSVVMEEMLHMALVANLLTAVGGKARVTHPSFIPTYPDYLPHSTRSFRVSLAKFSREVVSDFMKIEKPDPHGRPEDDYFASIGDFYMAVRDGLVALCRKHGEKKVFSGDPNRQITPEYYYGGAGEVKVIRKLADADDAVKEIVDQGEGAPGDVFEQHREVRPAEMASVRARAASDGSSGLAVAGTSLEAHRHRRFSGEEEPAHYYRFQEVYEGRYYQAGDKAKTGPRGPELPVQWDAVHNMRPNPKAADYPKDSPIRNMLDGFNRCYMRFLGRLEQGFTGRPDQLVNAVGDMYEIKHRAVELMRIPSGDGETTVGPSFEYVRT